jgi:hypothetical protein
MRYIVTLLVTLVFAACSRAPASHNQSQAESAGLAPDAQKASTDSPVEFLLTASASDFHAHRRAFSTRFRGVRFGRFMTPAGAQQYMLCGEFLPQQEPDKAEWSPFATIRTSGYEQYVGAQAASFCQRPQVVWDKDEDLSSTLQNRFDSLR